MSTVFVVGSLNIDQNIRVHALPRAGETVWGTDAAFSPGGKGGNQAVAAARARATVKFTGAVGGDAHGRRILEVLSEAHIDVGHVRVSGTAATGTAIIAVDDQGKTRSSSVRAQTPDSPQPTSKPDSTPSGTGDVLVLQLEIRTDLVRQAARIAKSRGAFVILNAAPAPRQLEGLLDAVDLLVVNEQEIQVLAGLAGMTGSHRELVQALPPALGPTMFAPPARKDLSRSLTAILCTCRLPRWPPRTQREPGTRSLAISLHAWPETPAN